MELKNNYFSIIIKIRTKINNPYYYLIKIHHFKFQLRFILVLKTSQTLTSRILKPILISITSNLFKRTCQTVETEAISKQTIARLVSTTSQRRRVAISRISCIISQTPWDGTRRCKINRFDERGVPLKHFSLSRTSERDLSRLRSQSDRN